SLVDEALAVRMALEETGGDRVGWRGFNRGPENRGFRLTPGQEGDFPGLPDRANTHPDRAFRDIPFTPKNTPPLSPGQSLQRHHPGARIGSGTRLIEPDVAGAADPKDLEIDTTRHPDLFFVFPAILEHFRTRDQAIGYVNILSRNIDFLEELYFHEVPITLGMS